MMCAIFRSLTRAAPRSACAAFWGVNTASSPDSTRHSSFIARIGLDLTSEYPVVPLPRVSILATLQVHRVLLPYHFTPVSSTKATGSCISPDVISAHLFERLVDQHRSCEEGQQYRATTFTSRNADVARIIHADCTKTNDYIAMVSPHQTRWWGKEHETS